MAKKVKFEAWIYDWEDRGYNDSREFTAELLGDKFKVIPPKGWFGFEREGAKTEWPLSKLNDMERDNSVVLAIWHSKTGMGETTIAIDKKEVEKMKKAFGLNESRIILNQFQRRALTEAYKLDKKIDDAVKLADKLGDLILKIIDEDLDPDYDNELMQEFENMASEIGAMIERLNEINR